MLCISPQTARRFVLGHQGLWPGRRWRAPRGTVRAMRAMEYLQLDPLNIIARSQDLALHSRVLDYTPETWEIPAYRRRRFFDWGGWLALRPMEELPYWRVQMRRERDHHPHLRDIPRQHAAAVAEMRLLLRRRDTISNRELQAGAHTRVSSYRGRKDGSLALYYLWRTGEAMIHHRERFERVYAASDKVAPAGLLAEAPEEAADLFLVRKHLAFLRLASLSRLSEDLGRRFDGRELQRWRTRLLATGEIAEVRIEGRRTPHYVLSGDLPLLHLLEAGRLPRPWNPAGPTTEEEVVFLAPLDPVCARGRAKSLFGFDYVWEVYKPAEQRRWGYYTLPVLWGDRLVARVDLRLDRRKNVLAVLGFWAEDPALVRDGEFAGAMQAGLRRLIAFLGATEVGAPPGLPRAVRSLLRIRPRPHR